MFVGKIFYNFPSKTCFRLRRHFNNFFRFTILFFCVCRREYQNVDLFLCLLLEIFLRKVQNYHFLCVCLFRVFIYFYKISCAMIKIRLLWSKLPGKLIKISFSRRQVGWIFSPIDAVMAFSIVSERDSLTDNDESIIFEGGSWRAKSVAECFATQNMLWERNHKNIFETLNNLNIAISVEIFMAEFLLSFLNAMSPP